MRDKGFKGQETTDSDWTALGGILWLSCILVEVSLHRAYSI